jgi:hypothetical protein
MKILVLCSAGNVRSVATAWELKKHGYDALAAGVDTNQIDTINFLCYWADKILLAQPEMKNQIPTATEVQRKIDEGFTIGWDVWNDPTHPALRDRVKRELFNIKLIPSPFKYDR